MQQSWEWGLQTEEPAAGFTPPTGTPIPADTNTHTDMPKGLTEILRHLPVRLWYHIPQLFCSPFPQLFCLWLQIPSRNQQEHHFK